MVPFFESNYLEECLFQHLYRYLVIGIIVGNK